MHSGQVSSRLHQYLIKTLKLPEIPAFAADLKKELEVEMRGLPPKNKIDSFRWNAIQKLVRIEKIDKQDTKLLDALRDEFFVVQKVVEAQGMRSPYKQKRIAQSPVKASAEPLPPVPLKKRGRHLQR
jgi:hypothetical protein